FLLLSCFYFSEITAIFPAHERSSISLRPPGRHRPIPLPARLRSGPHPPRFGRPCTRPTGPPPRPGFLRDCQTRLYILLPRRPLLAIGHRPRRLPFPQHQEWL